MLARRRAAVGIPVGDALRARLDVRLDRRCAGPPSSRRSPTLPDASASARCSCASRARNSAGVRSAASIASSTRAASAVERAGSARERRRRPPSRARAGCARRRRAGNRCAATCSRRSADMPPRGVAMMIAPAVGPEPVPVRMRPITSSTRSASRTLERPTPRDCASSRSGASRSPGARAPSSRSDSICSSTICQARAASGTGLLVVWSDHTTACGQTTQVPLRQFIPRRSPPRCAEPHRPAAGDQRG